MKLALLLVVVMTVASRLGLILYEYNVITKANHF